MDPMVEHLIEKGMVFVIGVLGIIVVTGVAWFRTRRARPAVDDALQRHLEEMAAQLNRIETAVEASAIEIERVSEAQRFTSRLLAERGMPDPLTAGKEPSAVKTTRTPS
jgi:hypothetical protein